MELPVDQALARQAVTDDLHRLVDALTELGLGVRDPRGRDRVVTSADAIRSGAVAPFSPAFRASAEVRLFEIAEPTPLAFPAATGRELLDSGRTSSVVRSTGRLRPRSPERRPGLIDALDGLLSRLRGRFEKRAREERSDPTERSDRREPRGRREPRPGPAQVRRRGPLVLGTAIVGVTIAVLVLVPTSAPARSTRAADESTGPRARPVASQPATEQPASPAPSGSPSDAPAPGTPAGSREDVVVGARAALDGIAGCAAAPDDSCWRSMIEADTALLAELSTSPDPLSALPAALTLPVDAVEIHPHDDYGDVRVVLVTPSDGTRPASVLMVRTEAGWRVRDAFDA